MSREDDVAKLAARAVEFDRLGKYEAAIYFYGEAAESILDLLKDGNGENLRAKAECYLSRAEEIKAQVIQAVKENTVAPKSQQQQDLERAEFLLYQALNEDEDGDNDDAMQLYIQATELCLQAGKACTDFSVKSKLQTLAKKAMERAELLKRKVGSNKPPPTNISPNKSYPPLGIQGLNLKDEEPVSKSVGFIATGKSAAACNGYAKDELEVLKSVSRINGKNYVPFLSVDLKEKFAYPTPFTDKDGTLPLAAKQKSKFKRWARPEEYLENPTIIDKVDSGTIKQTIVSDCSFIASLAIAARYERKTGKKLVTSIIYPQNRKGEPVFNPCGKYMIKLNLNGISRKVIIDDQLPMGQYGDLLCSYSQNRNELWVSLLEKAYMKVMGGYDFPGSNSNIDLHALTGWIPERIAIRKDAPDFNADQTFDKLLDRYHRGDCLVTLATGKMSQAEADRAGLVDCHAYAMLDIRKVLGKRMFMLKNPWNHLRWKGRFSERDMDNWTPDMRRALDYNPNDAQQFDDGVFWIDYESVLHFYDVFYINWTPTLFPYTYCLHNSWLSGSGPVKDLYSIADNPQFSLDVNSSNETAAVWILLTRHITEKEDFADNREYITILVYKADGKKVFYPFDPPPYIDGTRINSPHYLCKMVLPKNSAHRFTLVVAQYEKLNSISYTLRVYSTAEFRLTKISDNYDHKKKEVGGWKGPSAGGCPNHKDSYKQNPIYQISLETSLDNNDMCIDLKGPKQYSVGFEVVQVSSTNNKLFAKQSSGSYRPGFCMKILENVPCGVYNVIPCTFLPKQEGHFFLTIKSSCAIRIKRLQ